LQPDASAAAILVDEFDASVSESPADRFYCPDADLL